MMKNSHLLNSATTTTFPKLGAFSESEMQNECIRPTSASSTDQFSLRRDHRINSQNVETPNKWKIVRSAIANDPMQFFLPRESQK
jgi:hypothetical protein